MSAEIDTKELLREIVIKLDFAEDFRLGQTWLELLRRAAVAMAQLQQQIEDERRKVHFLVGQNQRLLEEKAAEAENFFAMRMDKGVI